MRYIALFYIYILYLQLIELTPTRTTESLKGRRIIGGEDADEEKYAYVVRLQLKIIFYDGTLNAYGVVSLHECTGAVLTPIWTLTASHCLDDYKNEENKSNSTKELILKYGPWNNATNSKVLNSVQHPAYKLRQSDLINDIALIRNEPIRLKQYARISALDHVNMVGQEVVMTGYGTTQTFVGPLSVASDTMLLKKPLQILDVLIVQCDKNDVFPIRGPSLCLARRCGKAAGICPGDSGGPVLHSSGVVGVNSIGPRQMHEFCNLNPYTPFYDIAGVTPTSPYIEWISATINNEVLVHMNNGTTQEQHQSTIPEHNNFIVGFL